MYEKNRELWEKKKRLVRAVKLLKKLNEIYKKLSIGELTIYIEFLSTVDINADIIDFTSMTENETLFLITHNHICRRIIHKKENELHTIYKELEKIRMGAL